jgi:hypothetical protein
VRDASDAAKLQDFRRCRLVIRYLMRNRIVQSEIISEREVPLWPALHDDKPALGSGFDCYAVIGAIPCHGIHERSMAVQHFKLTKVLRGNCRNLLPESCLFQQVNFASRSGSIKAVEQCGK